MPAPARIPPLGLDGDLPQALRRHDLLPECAFDGLPTVLGARCPAGIGGVELISSASGFGKLGKAGEFDVRRADRPDQPSHLPQRPPHRRRQLDDRGLGTPAGRELRPEEVPSDGARARADGRPLPAAGDRRACRTASISRKRAKAFRWSACTPPAPTAANTATCSPIPRSPAASACSPSTCRGTASRRRPTAGRTSEYRLTTAVLHGRDPRLLRGDGARQAGGHGLLDRRAHRAPSRDAHAAEFRA